MCVFCNQRTISGRQEFDISTVEKEIETALATIDTEHSYVEIAFFGGSFTGIDRSLMVDLLKIANRFISDGQVHSVRCSTRPDYIDEEILSILEKYCVKTIELGIQSTSDGVLLASKRGHTSLDSEKACRMIVNSGFNLVGQMMVGLPSATIDDELKTAEFICKMGATGARIYPTVVFNDSELKFMCENEAYNPLTVDEAVDRTKEVMKVFILHGVDIIRVGLCSSDNLVSDDTYYAGPNHVAIRELCEGEIYFDSIISALDNNNVDFNKKTLLIRVPRGEVSKVCGHNKRNKTKIKEKYGISRIAFEECDMPKYHISVDILDKE